MPHKAAHRRVVRVERLKAILPEHPTCAKLARELGHVDLDWLGAGTVSCTGKACLARQARPALSSSAWAAARMVCRVCGTLAG